MTLGPDKSSTFYYRSYRDEDHEDVLELCKNIYGGRDYVPRVVAACAADSSCSPRVIQSGSKVVAFCNVRVLESDDEDHHVIYIEAVRVSESVQGRGLGTRILQETMDVTLAGVTSTKTVRFLSTTIPENMAMRRIFEKAGWACRSYAQIWPSYSAVLDVNESGNDVRHRVLDLLGVSCFIPHSAMAAIPLWEQVTESEEILRTMQTLREAGSCFLQPRYYSLDTATGASKFLQSQFCKEEGRTVWKLERELKPPVLVFLRLRTIQPSDPQPDQVASACAVDISGAECCIAFVASRQDLGCFRIVFDPAISSEAMKKSVLLSKLATSTFMIFETRK